MSSAGSLEELRQSLRVQKNRAQRFRAFTGWAAAEFKAEECGIFLYQGQSLADGFFSKRAEPQFITKLLSLPGPQVCLAQEPLTLPAVYSKDKSLNLSAQQQKFLAKFPKLEWLLAASLPSLFNPHGTVLVVGTGKPPAEIGFALARLQQAADLLAMELICEDCLGHQTSAAQIEHNDTTRLLSQGRILIVRTDSKFKIQEVVGDAEKLVGLSSDHLLHNELLWQQLISSSDRRRLLSAIRSLSRLPRELSLEVKIQHQQSAEKRWLLLRGIPIYGTNGEIERWEGFGLDVTEQRRDRLELESQRVRLAALYQVSQAIALNRDPAVMLLKGLQALIEATGSDGGFGCFYNEYQDHLDLVASHGLSESYLNALDPVLNQQSLARYAVIHRQGLMRSDLSADPNAPNSPSVKEGFRSAVVMPLMVEDLVLGVILLFSKRVNRYRRQDFDLVSAAASQISLAARQALGYAAEQQHLRSLSAMYRVTHALSTAGSQEELLQSAFKAINQECPGKRFWYGELNDLGAALDGIAAFGPGMTSRVARLEVPLYPTRSGIQSSASPTASTGNIAEKQLDQQRVTEGAVVGQLVLTRVLMQGEPTIVEVGREDCQIATQVPAVARVLGVLRPKLLILVPVSGFGERLGVLVFEPLSRSVFAAESFLPILAAAAGELGTAIVTRRHQASVTKSEKMRLAEVLSSGVAHNFNNLLQVVMGQASLIQMQVGSDSPAATSARMIVDAAARGATLVGQLRQIAGIDTGRPGPFSLRALIESSAAGWEQLINGHGRLVVDLEEGSFELVGQRDRINQALYNLIWNARDALVAKKLNAEQGRVRLAVRRQTIVGNDPLVELRPGDYLRIEVEDNGIGMDEELKARCFDPFFSTKSGVYTSSAERGSSFAPCLALPSFDPAALGSVIEPAPESLKSGVGDIAQLPLGLGLSTVYSVVRQHEGSITVVSEPSKGSVFTVLLPVAGPLGEQGLKVLSGSKVGSKTGLNGGNGNQVHSVDLGDLPLLDDFEDFLGGS